MRCKLVISALAAGALLGAATIASAQTQPAPGESNVGAGAAKSNNKPATTTGSAMKPHTNKGVAPNPTTQRPNDAGTGRGK